MIFPDTGYVDVFGRESRELNVFFKECSLMSVMWGWGMIDVGEVGLFGGVDIRSWMDGFDSSGGTPRDSAGES